MGPAVLALRKEHGIEAPAPGHEPDLSTSAQAVDGEKHLVPRQIGALTCDVFEVAGLNSLYDVDDLIFNGRRLCHAPPLLK